MTRAARDISRVLLGVAVALLLALTLPGCGTQTSTTEDSPSASPSTASDSAHKSVEDFRGAIEEPGTVVLDVRTPQEYAAGHLPDAVNLDVEDPSFDDRLGQLDDSVTYAVYCRSGNRSDAAMEQMTQAGFDHVYSLDAGFVAWQAAGGAVVTG